MENEAKNVNDNFVESSMNQSIDGSAEIGYSSPKEENNSADNRNSVETFAEQPNVATNTRKDDGFEGGKTKSNAKSPYKIVVINNGDDANDGGLNENNNAKGVNSINVRKLLIFGMPPVLLLLYIGFYLVLIPAIYGRTISFFDWLLADVNHIVEFLRDASNILTPVVVVDLLVILQYILLGAFIVSVFFMARELHNPKVKINENVKYVGKEPQKMLENVLMTLKNKSSVFGRSVIDDLKIVVESLRCSKAFGVSNDASVIALEEEMCLLIDELQAELAFESDDTAKKVSNCVMALKQKNVLRDATLRK